MEINDVPRVPHFPLLADVTDGEWGVVAETNDKVRQNAFTVTINNPLAKTAKIDETQVRGTQRSTIKWVRGWVNLHKRNLIGNLGRKQLSAHLWRS